MHRALVTLLIARGLLGGAVGADEPASNPRPALPYPKKIEPVTVCGDKDDSQHVELYKGDLGVDKTYVATHEPSTVQLQWIKRADMAKKFPGYAYGNVASERWCTGTLITESLVLTAGHCFDVQKDQFSWITPYKTGTNEFLQPADLAKLQVANFRYQVNAVTGAIRTAEVYPVVRLVEYRQGNLDYAIVELGKNASGALPSTTTYPPAHVVTRQLQANDVIAVIQHPRGDPKKVEAGHVKSAAGAAVLYSDVDTHGGSSGSGVRDAEGAVVGVHTNGGCEAIGGANRGVTTSAIAAVSNVF